MTGIFYCYCGNAGVERILNKSQHRKFTLEKKILTPLLRGLEPETFRSRVRHSDHWAITAKTLLAVWYYYKPEVFDFPGVSHFIELLWLNRFFLNRSFVPEIRLIYVMLEMTGGQKHIVKFTDSDNNVWSLMPTIMNDDVLKSTEKWPKSGKRKRKKKKQQHGVWE